MKSVGRKTVTIRCKVVSGIGEGSKYIRLSYYEEILKSILNGEKPYPGTLNILCDIDYKALITKCKPRTVSNFRSYGGFYYWYAILKYSKLGNNYVKLDVVILRPFLSKHKGNVLEIVSSTYLRNYLGLRDGDVVELDLFCSEGV